MGIREVSPIDGRYKEKTKELEEVFSEFALQRERTKIEIYYLLFLSEKKIIRKVSEKEKETLQKIFANFEEKEMLKVKEIEKKTNHDVKAIEYFVREKLEGTSLKDLGEFVHFGLTSEDVSNLAYSLLLQKGIEIYLKAVERLLEEISEIAEKNKKTAMLAHTHGQAATPTTLGKELVVFALRINGLKKEIEAKKMPGKLNSATGNFNAHKIAFPETDWVEFSKEFVSSLGLKPVLLSTQIIPHEEISSAFREMAGINNAIINLDRDMWAYISMDYLKQKVKEGEVGSSIMPHKVNPIQFENSEGNLLMANAVLEFLASQLQFSRMQRDLTDSTIKRNYGIGFAYSVIGIKSAVEGLRRVEANREKMLKELRENSEVLAEAIQTCMRKEGIKGAYEKLKEFSRGKKLGLEEIREFIEKSGLSDKEKKKLQALKPETYLGEAVRLTEIALKELKK